MPDSDLTGVAFALSYGIAVLPHNRYKMLLLGGRVATTLPSISTSPLRTTRNTMQRCG